jgi:hypothetical protein
MRRTQKSPSVPFINSVLASQNLSTKIPHYRTIQRWWAKIGEREQEKKQRNNPKVSWTKEPHHTWQIDGKEQITLSDGTQVCWMNIADEATSTALQTEVFPQMRVTEFSEKEVALSINTCFNAEGLPKRIKIDNGLPLARPQQIDVPTLTELWWTGLGIEVIRNQPVCPDQNGTVEGLQGILQGGLNRQLSFINS